jgi:hypothetical protein
MLWLNHNIVSTRWLPLLCCQHNSKPIIILLHEIKGSFFRFSSHDVAGMYQSNGKLGLQPGSSMYHWRRLFFKLFFYLKYIKIIFFLFLKIIFDINIILKNIKKIIKKIFLKCKNNVLLTMTDRAMEWTTNSIFQRLSLCILCTLLCLLTTTDISCSSWKWDFYLVIFLKINNHY